MLLTAGLHAAAPMSYFPLGEVQLLESRFKENMERNATYMLSLEPDRYLHNTRKFAGLEPKGEIYGFWERMPFAGHTLGHYLSALSLQFVATGDKRFKERLDYTVKEMAECQKGYGDGYVGSLFPTELEGLRAIKQGNVTLKDCVVPWYTQHKILAGLVDAWRLTGNDQAREVALRLADWVDDLTAGLTPEKQEQMLRMEHGGMIEILVEIHHLTGNSRYLETAKRFYHRAVFDPLLAGRDELDGLHANTQIPKILGLARRYELTGNADDRKIAEFFWNTVVHNRTWALGGNSDRERFFPVGKAHEHLTSITAETCNTHNMLKLTRYLMAWEPTVERADYFERALYNHILASQEPKQGMFTYYVSLRPGHYRMYSKPYDSFWCCVGTGMENHTKYAESIYLKGGEKLYVNLFIPSVLTWKEKGLILEQRTRYPYEETTELTIQSAPEQALPILVRGPAWTKGPISCQLNGERLEVAAKPGQYAEFSRVWKKGDRLRITFPMALRTEELEGSKKKVALFYGPLLLAGDLGPVPATGSYPYAQGQGTDFLIQNPEVPVLVPESKDLLGAVKRVPDNELLFRTEGLGRPSEVTLRPFNEIFYNHYNVYWDVLSEGEYHKRLEDQRAEKERLERDQARVVDRVEFGQSQSENDHALVSEKSKTGVNRKRPWRDTAPGGFFEFAMKPAGDAGQHTLRFTYWGWDENRKFDILVDGAVVGTQELELSKPDEFFTVDYPLRSDLTAGKQKITVRVQANYRKPAGPLFVAELLRD